MDVAEGYCCQQTAHTKLSSATIVPNVSFNGPGTNIEGPSSYGSTWATRTRFFILTCAG